MDINANSEKLQSEKSKFWAFDLLISLLLILLLTGNVLIAKNAEYVDPFIGTGGGGNTFPGAVVPWGMVSISPHNDLEAPSGYKYGKSYIYGFGHVHLSGTGCSDLGNILVIPTTGKINIRENNYRSRYSKEKAVPGYYKVFLKDYSITAEVTATIRAGFHRYAFPTREKDANIIIDVSHTLSPCKDSYVKIISDTEVEGWSRSGGFCSKYSGNQQTVYFYAKFSKSALSYGTWKDDLVRKKNEQSGNNIGAFLRFSTSKDEAIYIKVGISYVSIANAGLNLDTEIPDWDFENIKRKAHDGWNKELGKIDVKGGTSAQKKIFYTGLYHMLVHPNVFNDVNDEYQGMRETGVKKAGGYTRYTVYSLWDTYRNVHPFLTLVYPERQLDMVKTMVEMYKEGGWLPKWELCGYETGVMVGDPAVPVIADTYLKGVTNFDIQTAYEGMKKGATQESRNPLRPGLKAYLKFGYIPFDDALGDWVWGSVSTGLEYLYADWCIAQLAGKLGKQGDYEEFLRRSKFYKNYYDPKTGFLRPKNKDGSWLEPFDPASQCCDKNWGGSGGPGYVEGNSWHYTFFVPHDIKGLMDLMGGEVLFVEKLQECFDTGNFVMWNEPDMAYPYLFAYANAEAWRTQKYVRESIKKHFHTGPDGIPGNDDAGTTSAWLVFSAMGFYPDCPGKDFFSLGSPVFDKITIELNQKFYPGSEFAVQTKNNSSKNIYIKSATLNGKKYNKPYLSYKDIINGGKLVLNMGDKKSYWGGIPEKPEIISHPEDMEVTEGEQAVFRIRVKGTGPFKYQWKSNAIDILNANHSSYNINRVSIKDNNRKFRCYVETPFGTTESKEAGLRVIPDTIPPGITSAYFQRQTTEKITEIIAQGENTGSGETKENLIDGDVKTKWLDFANSHPDTRSSWVQLKFGYKKYIITGYKLTSANDLPERDPRDWKLAGFNDDKQTWDVLDTRRNESFSGRFQTREFKLKNKTAYNICRLIIESVQKSGRANSVQLAEIEFIYQPFSEKIGDGYDIIVEFSESLNKKSAEDISNYRIDKGISINNVFLDIDLKTVILSISDKILEKEKYILYVNGVKDRAGIPNIIDSNTRKEMVFKGD